MTTPAIKVPLLDALTPEGRDALTHHAIKRRYSAGEILWSAGDRSTGITLVLDGKVRIVRGNEGRLTVIHSGEAGSTLGEIPFFTGSSYPATAIAAEPTTCLILNDKAVRKALAVDTGLAFYFLARLSLRVQSLVDRIDQIAVHSVQARLARFFLRRIDVVAEARPRTKLDDDRPAFSLGMTQAELAEELGTVREVVVRALRALKDLGAIEPAGDGKYRVGDRKVLERLAEPAAETQ